MITSKLRLLFVALLILGASQTTLYGQSTLGVTWDVPGNIDSAHTQLQQFHELGISILEIDSQPAPEIWNRINKLGFTVYGNLGINFPISRTFAEPDSSFVTHLENRTSTYLLQPSVKAIGLFNYGNIRTPVFLKAVSPYAAKISGTQNIPLYFKTSTAPETEIPSISFPIVSVSVTPSNYDSLVISTSKNDSKYLYNPSKELKPYLKPFKNFVTAVGPSAGNTIFVRSGWLFEMIKKYPQFSITLRSLSSDQEPVFPLPDEKIPSPDNSSLPMILLLLIWGTVALHYNTSPLYRKSLFRYFTAHKFFIDDIFNRHIRSPLPAIIIITQNALLISISLYVLFSELLTPMGQEAFFHYFTELAIVGQRPLSIFMWTLIIVLILCLISTSWLYFSHKKIRSFTQSATLYAWPLQLNFLFCTATITFSATSGTVFISLLTALALLLVLLSYIFAALDINRFAPFKGKHLFKTVIPYTMIIAGLLGWFFTNDQWLAVLTLAYKLT